ncbi:hypothetical protein [Microbacterium sp. zg-YB36]|uniref:hypothetical protein n=1 Tax=Microbacterium sp. zg-YB36 TaxID=2969407 RepID=UPI00214BB842|nr:hypothetical protein [Microbacterium sp. zg-YB36]MDL5352397.1 hypothetical protein [Microbacterium sp. zg-YB36]
MAPEARRPRVEGAPQAPARPSLAGKQAAPVIVKLPPPVSIRAAQLGWVLSMLTGAVAVVYLFIIRETQLPAMVEAVKAVDATRAEETYTTAADIIYWTAFGILAVVLLVQVTSLVSFNNRRPKARWWQFGSVVLLGMALIGIRELVAVGERGLPLTRILALQVALALLALGFSVLPPALKWSARRHDVRTAAPGVSGADL